MNLKIIVVFTALFAFAHSNAQNVSETQSRLFNFDRFNILPSLKPRRPSIVEQANAAFQEALRLSTTQIPQVPDFGEIINELPNVINELPDVSEILDPPSNSLLDQVLALVPPLDGVIDRVSQVSEMVFDRFNTNPRLVDRSIPRPTPDSVDSVVGLGFGESGRTVAEAFIPFPPEFNECPGPAFCPSNPFDVQFYLSDGGCNNAFDPARGQAKRAFKRLLPPDYGDGVGSPRQGNGPFPLPSARNVSMAISGFGPPPISDFTTQFVPFWGQFMIHDVTDTPTSDRPEGIDCNCGSQDPLCYNIPLFPNDLLYLAGKDCLPLVRSKSIQNNKCDSVKREQENEVTSFLDASSVYGSSQEELEALLDPDSIIGELLVGDGMFDFPNTQILPFTTQAPNVVTACPMDVHTPQNVPCFVAGDKRANEQPGLTSLHQAFLTYHNFVVRSLNDFNPSWDRNRLINEARRIVSALSQRITYDLFLPIIVGPTYMKRFGLNLVENGYSYGYDPSIDATVANSFAAAAFRMGHTLVRGQTRRLDPEFNNVASPLVLSSNFFSSVPFQNELDGGKDSILRGMAVEPSQTMDTMFSRALQLFLFRPAAGGLGSDLLALNIQRGRDHGLPGYNRFRELCGLKRARNFVDFIEIPREARDRLEAIYRGNVNDVDLYPAGIAETPARGALLGPTFACIISYQFRGLKKGDRFWHENGGTHQVFTPAQLTAIKNYGLPRFLCDFATGTRTIQPNPLVQPNRARNPTNERRACDEYPSLNLFPWAEFFVFEPEVNSEQDFEFTPFFPLCDGECVTEAYLRLLKSRPADVCADSQGSEEETVNGVRLVRFRCLPGAIRGTDFPEITANTEWSNWESNPVQRNGDDVESRPRQGHQCVKPTAIQAITVDGVPARETGEIFEEFSPTKGLVCRGFQQRDNMCEDYMVRYRCNSLLQSSPTDPPTTTTTTTTEITTTLDPNGYSWTSWSNTNTPDRRTENERLSRVETTAGFCSNPDAIESRDVATQRATTQSVFMSPRFGLRCFTILNNNVRCRDHEVRYRCKNSDINPV